MGGRVYIANQFPREDTGDGGVRRVVEAQRRYLPALGWDVVDTPEDADLLVGHSGAWVPRTRARDAVRVFHCHGLYWSDYQWGAWAQQKNRALIDLCRKADMVICDSSWVANTLQRDLLLDAKVVYNGIESPPARRGRPRKDAAAAPEHEAYVLWNKARVDPVCEVDSLGLLVGRMPDVEFVSTFAPKRYMDIAAREGGSGPWQVAANLKVTGKVPYADALDWVRRAGVYLATTRESFSVGVLEAMSQGVPVVGYDWGGTREVVEHRRSGWLAAPGDIDGLAAGVEYVFAHWDEMSRAAVERVIPAWTWKGQMARCAALYAEALERYGRAGKPRVSVVIPCHNMEQYVGAAIDSALSQKVQGGHEIIVVDDASTDRSREAIREHFSGTVVELPENQYLAGALNAGIAEAQGEYILNLDADNVLPPGALATLVRALDSGDDGDVAYGAVQFVLEDGETPDARIGKGGIPHPAWPPPVFDYGLQMQHRNQVQSSAMFRKRVWERLGGYRQHVGVGGVRLNSDADFWCRAATVGFHFARVTAEPTLIYRQRADSMSRTVPEYDWTAWCPKESVGARVPMGVSGHPSTLEPVAVTVIVMIPEGAEKVAWKSVESLWPQTFDNWECITVHPIIANLHWAPYTRSARDLGDALARARGAYILLLNAGEYLHPDALSRLVGAVQWSEKTHRSEERARFAYSDWMDPDTGKIYRANDDGVGAVLAPRSLVGRSDPSWGQILCGQYVEGPLLVVGGRGDYDARRGDQELAGCGCGGGGRRQSAPGTARGCIGPGCGGNGAALTGGRVQRSAARDAQLISGGTAVRADEPMTLMRYVGGASSRTFRMGGRTYLFGQDRGHREKYVYTTDVPQLLLTRQLEAVVQGGADVTPMAEPADEMVAVGVE